MLTSISTSVPFRGLASQPMNDLLFNKTTVIFGRNGAGKTTLGDLLQHLGVDRPMTAGIDPSSIVTQGETSSVRAFNQRYIDSNLRGFLDGDGEGRSIAIGKPSIDLADEKKMLTGQLLVRKKWEEEVETRLKKIPTENVIGDDAKADLISQLGTYDSSRYHPSIFRNDAKFRLRIQTLQAKSIPSKELANHRNTAGASDLQKVPSTSEQASLLRLPDFSKIAETLSSNPGNDLANILLDRDGFKDWLESGLQHFDQETAPFCPFCRRMPQQDRMDAIRETFNDVLASLERSIEGHLEDVQKIISDVESFSATLSNITDVAHSVASEYDAAKEAFAAQVDEFVAGVRPWRDALLAKKANLRSDPPAPTLVEALPDHDLCIELLNEHNEEVENQAWLRNEALEALEGAVLGPYRSTFEEAQGDRAKHERASRALARSINEIETRLVKIAALEQDTHEMALALTQDVRAILGNDSLAITTSPDGKKYKILRNADPAKYLSAGEKNLIALSYFLRTLNDKDANPKETTVIMDDPVTSLDRENALSAFTMIQTMSADWAQFIVLTHEYDFLRSCVAAWPVDETHPTVTHLEVTKRWNSSKDRPESFLRVLPDELSKFSSEYHYLFNLVMRCARGEVDSMLLSTFGNSARRLLEGFLSFVRPVTPEFRNSLVSAWAEVEGATELVQIRDRALRFGNNTSHHVRSSPMHSTPTPAEPIDFVCVLYVMKRISPSHFNEMAQMVIDSEPAGKKIVNDLFRNFEAANSRVKAGVNANLSL